MNMGCPRGGHKSSSSDVFAKRVSTSPQGRGTGGGIGPSEGLEEMGGLLNHGEVFRKNRFDHVVPGCENSRPLATVAAFQLRRGGREKPEGILIYNVGGFFIDEDAALVQEHHPIGDALDVGHVVRRKRNGRF